MEYFQKGGRELELLKQINCKHQKNKLIKIMIPKIKWVKYLKWYFILKNHMTKTVFPKGTDFKCYYSTTPHPYKIDPGSQTNSSINSVMAT